MKSFETTIKPLLKYGDGVAKETGKKFKEFGCTKVLAGYDANLPESVVSTVLDSITAEGGVAGIDEECCDPIRF